MPKIHSHYENLKVPRDASSEAIRTAYRTLSQKHHPDRNSDKEDATRVMMVLNTAYETLSDPVTRRRHDLWIAMAEGRPLPDAKPYGGSSRRRTYSAYRSRRRSGRSADPGERAIAGHLLRYGFWYGLAAIALFGGWALFQAADPFANSSPLAPDSAFDPKNYPVYQANPAPGSAAATAGSARAPAVANVLPLPARAPAPPAGPAHPSTLESPTYQRPATTPNGQPWPAEAGYVRGYEVLRADGFFNVTIDNIGNGSDIFAKLVYLDGARAIPVRIVYIPGFGQMTLSKMSAGRYELRYRDLNSGELTRTEAFQLQESATPDGVEFSSVTVAVSRARSGNGRLHGISENEF